ncbi:MAG TPA: S8 family serine peptidase [Bacteroidota bacterium]|nr:S8 family serine peptidase [Bacteroidota bacterium]
MIRVLHSHRFHLLLFLLATLCSGLTAIAQTQPYYVYKGNRLYLHLNKNAFSVRYLNDKAPAQRVKEAASFGVSAASSQPMNFNHWHRLNLQTPVADESDASDQIRKLAAGPDVDFVSPVFNDDHGGPIVITPDVLVKIKSEHASNATAILNSIAPELSVVEEKFGLMEGVYRLKSSARNGFDVLASANKLAEEGRVEWAEPDMIVTGEFGSIPNDPSFSQLWGIRNTGQFGGTPGFDMKGDLAWNITTGDTSVKIMIIDCGVQQNHPDIHQRPGVDFTGQGGGGGPVNSCDNHGTAVAGCATAIINNSTGIVGIAPNCYVVSARCNISNSACDNSFTNQFSWVVNALAYAASHGIRITSNSSAYFTTSSAMDAQYQSTHDNNGMIHFAAAGNGSTSVYYPASLPVVNAVGATNPKGVAAVFSNFGPAMDFCAPGDSILVTDRTGTSGYSSGDYFLYRGTSFSTPYAAGVAALILSRFPSFTASQVEAKMQNSSVDLGTAGWDQVYGWGMVNAYNAVRSSCILTAPAPVTLSVDSLQCGTVVTYPPPASTGNCGPVTCSPPSGSFFHVGVNVVTCSDTSGNRCTFNVTVNGGGLTRGTLRDDFNRPDGPLPGSNKWVLIQNQPSAGSMSIVGSGIQAASSAGVNNFGGVVWDSLYGAGTEASVTVTQKSGNFGGFTSLFLYGRMNNKDYNTGTGYRLRYLEQSGTDYLQIQRVGPGYANLFDLASVNREINAGDVLTFRVLCDNQSMAILVNGQQILTATDTTYTVPQWYFAVRSCVFSPAVRFDNFQVSPIPGPPPPPPSAPTLLSPANGSLGQPATLTASWNASAGAATYRVQVSTDSLFGTKFLDDSTVAGTSRQVGPLAGSTKYFWRVNAKNPSGTSAFSGVWNFTTGITPPPAPTLVSPANGSTNQPTSLTLNWNPASGAASYRTQIATDSLFTTLVFDDSTDTTTSRLVSSLSNSTLYYWRVNAKNSGGTSPYSAAWKFTTVITAPAPPVLSSPANGSVNQSTSPTLQWNPAGGATSYHVQLASDALFASIVLDDSTVAGTSRQVGPLSGISTYFWRVSAKNSGGTSAYSSVWNFTTGIAPPPAPTLVSPANGSTNQPTSLTLSWNSSPTAASYRVQVATDSLFTTLVLDDSTDTTTSRQVSSLSNSTLYYWRVSAKNTGGSSGFSSTWNFTTVIALPQPPALTAPANGALCQPATLSLTWTASAGASSYHVQLATDSLFGSIVLDDSTIASTTRQVTSLSVSTTYYWKVSAKNGAGASPYSATWKFSTFMAGTLRDDFNRPDGPLPGSNKWSLIQNQPSSGSVSIVSNAIRPSSGAGSFNFGGVVWDSLVGAGTEAGLTLAQKSGNTSFTSFFLYARMNNKDYNSGTGYRLRYLQQSGTDVLEIHRVGPGYVNYTTLAQTSVQINPGDVITFRILCDNQTMAAFVNSQQVLTVRDTIYQPSQWYFAIRGCVFPTPVILDNFKVSSGPAGLIIPPPPPSSPTLLSPGNGTVNQPTSPTLQWNPAGGATSYRVQLATDSLFASIVLDDSTVAGTSRQAGPLSSNSTYFWRVSAKNSGGTSAYSTVWNFTTGIAPPPAPTLVSPANGSTNQPTTLTLSWNSSATATSYRVQVASDSSFTALVLDDSTVTTTSRQVSSLSNSTLYYWRVGAKNAGGSSGFSSTWNFTTIVTAPPSPAPTSPLNGASCQATTLSLTWTASAGASSYHVQLSTDSLFGSIVLDDSTITTTTRQVTSLNSSTTYYWKVSAKNGAGPSPYSATWKFSTFMTGALRDDFNAPNGPLTGRNKWLLIQNQPSAGAMVISNNMTVASSSAGNFNFGGVVWDSLVAGGTEASLTLKQKSGNTSFTSLFMYARMNNLDYNTAVGYRLRYFQQSGSTDILEIHRVGPGYTVSSTLATASVAVNVNDVITFRVQCDNKSMIGFINGNPVISAVDTTYMPAQWRFAIRSCVFPTPVIFDDFKTTPQVPAGSSTLWDGGEGGKLKQIHAVVKEFALAQNHPNPFNPSTQIQYALPVDSRVSLRIYNTLGQVVKQMVDNAVQTSGSWTMEFDASNLASGVYFYRLEAASLSDPDKTFAQVKKMLLLR